RRPPSPPPFPYTTLFRSSVDFGRPYLHQRQPRPSLQCQANLNRGVAEDRLTGSLASRRGKPLRLWIKPVRQSSGQRKSRVVFMPDRKSTRLNSSHVKISY